MRGYIRKKGESWQIQVYTGTGPDGKYRRHFDDTRPQIRCAKKT